MYVYTEWNSYNTLRQYAGPCAGLTAQHMLCSAKYEYIEHILNNVIIFHLKVKSILVVQLPSAPTPLSCPYVAYCCYEEMIIVVWYC